MLRVGSLRTVVRVTISPPACVVMSTVETAVIGAPCGGDDVGEVEGDPVRLEVMLLVTGPVELAAGELGAELGTVVPGACASDEDVDGYKVPEELSDGGAGADVGGELDGLDVGFEGEWAGGEGLGVEGGGVGECEGGGEGRGGGFELEDEEEVGDDGGGVLGVEAVDEEELSVEVVSLNNQEFEIRQQTAEEPLKKKTQTLFEVPRYSSRRTWFVETKLKL